MSPTAIALLCVVGPPLRGGDLDSLMRFPVKSPEPVATERLAEGWVGVQDGYYRLANLRRDLADRCYRVLQSRVCDAEAVSDDELLLAIEGAGECRDPKSAELLVELLAFEYNALERALMTGSPQHIMSFERRSAIQCPAVDALVRLGVPAADACMKDLLRTKSLKERQKRYAVLYGVLGRARGRCTIETYREAFSAETGMRYNDQQKARFDERLKPFLAEYDEMFPPPEYR